MTPILRLRFVVARLFRDRSANALPEYAIVLAALTIVSVLAFASLGRTSTAVVTTNQNNFANTALQSYATP